MTVLKLALAASLALTGLAVVAPTAAAECHKVEIIDCGDFSAVNCKVVGTKTVCTDDKATVASPGGLTVALPAPPPKKLSPATKTAVRTTTVFGR